MASRTLAATTALVGAMMLGGEAAAADAGSTPSRKWGGFWLGFGAGDSEQSYGTELGRNFCFSSARGSAQAVCEFTDDSVKTTATASTPTSAAASAAAAASDGSQSIVGSATAVSVGDGTAAAADVTASTAPLSVSTSVAISDYTIAAATSSTSSGGGLQSAGTGLGESSGVGSSAASSLAFSDPSRGLLGSVSRASASGPSGNANALAVALSGVQDSLSGNDGALAGNINMRFDYQTESNWIFGAAVELTGMPNSNVRLQSETAVDAGGVSVVGRSIEMDGSALASARLRLGYALGDYMIYGTGGAAYTHFDATCRQEVALDGTSQSRSQSRSVDAVGGVIGGGVSVFVSDNAAVSLEGSYYMFDKTVDLGNGDNDASINLDNTFSVIMKFSIRAN